jgi:hypothetical protein
MEVEMDEEQREKEVMAAYARLLDRAQGAGAHMGATTRAFTGEFRQDGALVPTDGYGVAMVPAYHLNSAAGHGEEGFVVQLLLCSYSFTPTLTATRLSRWCGRQSPQKSQRRTL